MSRRSRPIHRPLVFALTAAAVLAGSASAQASTETYDGILAALAELEEAMPEVELSYYGSSAAGRRLPFVVVNRDRQFTAKRLARTGRPLVLLLAGVHGDEPGGAGAVLRFLRELRDGEHRALLDGANYLLVPTLDVDGLPAGGRPGRHATLAGLDLDRDWLKLEAEETRSLVAIVAGWKPQLVIDLHGGHSRKRPEESSGGDGLLLRFPAGSVWLEQALAGRDAVAVIDPRPGSSLGYFWSRGVAIVRLDAAAEGAGYPGDAVFGAVLEILAAVAGDPEALKRAAAGPVDPSPPAVTGYVVLPGWQRVESALRRHGIAGERLTASQKLAVETLVLAEPSFERHPEQGLHRVTCQVRSEQSTRVLPAGSLWIPTDQPLGAVVRELLEPSAPESLVSWGLISSLFAEGGGNVEAPILRAGRRPAGETRPWH